MWTKSGDQLDYWKDRSFRTGSVLHRAVVLLSGRLCVTGQDDASLAAVHALFVVAEVYQHLWAGSGCWKEAYSATR